MVRRGTDSLIPRKRRMIDFSSLWMTRNNINLIKKKRISLWNYTSIECYRHDFGSFQVFKEVHTNIRSQVKKEKRKFERRLVLSCVDHIAISELMNVYYYDAFKYGAVGIKLK